MAASNLAAVAEKDSPGHKIYKGNRSILLSSGYSYSSNGKNDFIKKCIYQHHRCEDAKNLSTNKCLNCYFRLKHTPQDKKIINPIAKNHSVVYYEENYKQIHSSFQIQR
jgi:hypothetical protein